MTKSPDAFRTISEVSEWLGVPPHVLRFWETRFTQVKPVKRAGGRRYYRPADMALLGGIRKLLHDDGLTIRGVQKLLREKGIRHVAELSQPVGEAAEAAVEPEQEIAPVLNEEIAAPAVADVDGTDAPADAGPAPAAPRARVRSGFAAAAALRRRNRNLSPEARAHLERLRAALDALRHNADAPGERAREERVD